jgi:2-polyprenyl-6-methoxyphenol hydroxylase-like FAD-dependent oxidoreductase
LKQRSVIIVGGGIAGLTLARFLDREGHGVQVLERTADFSAQGHTISLRGVGFQVMDLLALKARVERVGRDYSATRSLTLEGRPLRLVAQSAQARAVGGVAVTQRGLLHAALAEDLPSSIEIRFGARIKAVDQKDAAARVKLDDGACLSADIVVGADGANSAVRRMAFPDVDAVDFGGDYVGMTVNTDHGLPLGELRAYYGVARLVSLFPVGASRVAVVVYQDDSFEPVPESNAADAWTAYFARNYVSAAEPVRRILASLKDGDDIFHDRIRQVPPKRAAAGRIALVGDAGYCPTFFSGNGAALAAAGAYVLSKSLARLDDDRAALADYEARILPFAAPYQVNARRLRNVIFAHSPVRVALRRLAQRYTPQFVYAQGIRRHYRGEVRLSDIA